MKQMKNSLSGLFAVLSALLLFTQCNNNNTSPEADTELKERAVDQASLPVAYVDADSLLVKFEYYNGLVSSYENKLSKRNSSLNSGYQKLQSEAMTFQQKVQNNAFLTQDRYNQEQTRLQRMEEDLRTRAAQIEQEMALEQRQIQQQLSDSLNKGIKEFNTPQKYQMIFTKTGNSTILYADEKYNITEEVIDFLNKRFKAPKEK
jgi:outer membrane protein